MPDTQQYALAERFQTEPPVDMRPVLARMDLRARSFAQCRERPRRVRI
jgi:hypothetical protein